MNQPDLDAARRVYEMQKDRYAVHLQRWDADVRHYEKQGWDAQRIAADFGERLPG